MIQKSNSYLTLTPHVYRGFTLLELLVVIAIIGVLASVVLVAMSSAKKRGNDARITSDIRQMKLTLESNRGSDYSKDLNGAIATPNNWQTTGSSTIINSLIADVASNGGAVTIQTAGNPVSAYLLYGSLPSKNNTKYFCESSNHVPDAFAPNNTTAPAAAGSACP